MAKYPSSNVDYPTAPKGPGGRTTPSRPPPIHSWAPSDRPRERLHALGPGGISTRELLAILIGSGGAGGSALDVADRVLAHAAAPAAPTDPTTAEASSIAEAPSMEAPQPAPQEPSLRRLATLPPGALEAEPGVGKATAAKIQAALELGRRVAAEPAQTSGRIRGPRDVFARMGPILRDLQQEEFHALLLNTQHRILRDVLITRGILDASLIHPREVFRVAIVESAAGIILVHNHPSGDPTPSAEDRAVTLQLAAAGRAIGIPVLDHVIVGEGRYVSLSEDGGME